MIELDQGRVFTVLAAAPDALGRAESAAESETGVSGRQG